MSYLNIYSPLLAHSFDTSEFREFHSPGQTHFLSPIAKAKTGWALAQVMNHASNNNKFHENTNESVAAGTVRNLCV
jgi:hypothetical protein